MEINVSGIGGDGVRVALGIKAAVAVGWISSVGAGDESEFGAGVAVDSEVADL